MRKDAGYWRKGNEFIYVGDKKNLIYWNGEKLRVFVNGKEITLNDKETLKQIIQKCQKTTH